MEKMDRKELEKSFYIKETGVMIFHSCKIPVLSLYFSFVARMGWTQHDGANVRMCPKNSPSLVQFVPWVCNLLNLFRIEHHSFRAACAFVVRVLSASEHNQAIIFWQLWLFLFLPVVLNFRIHGCHCRRMNTLVWIQFLPLILSSDGCELILY